MKYPIQQVSTGKAYQSKSLVGLFTQFGREEGFWFSARFCLAIALAR